MEMDIDASPPSIADLPAELWLKILGNGLSFPDIKAVRLLCRRLAYGPSIYFLYRTVYLSRLRRDVESFLGIASQPRLAAEVRVIVWYELALDLPVLGHSTRSVPEARVPPCDHRKLPDSLLYRNMSGTIQNTIRYEVLQQVRVPPILSASNEEDGMHMDMVLPLPDLIKAAENMTGLHTLASQSMHPTRRITRRADKISYPVTVQLCNRVTMSRESNPTSGKSTFGLLSFLLPVAATRCLERPMTRLCFSLSSLAGFPIEDPPTLLFLNLTHLDLCISEVQHNEEGNPIWSKDHLASLAACMNSSINLVSLHLCFENGRGRTGEMSSPFLALETIILNSGLHAKWEKLRELRLSHCAFNAGTVAKFMQTHASSLKKLHLFDCLVTAETLLHIATSSISSGPLQLEELTILQSEAGDSSYGFEDDLVEVEGEEEEEDDQRPWWRQEPLRALRWFDEKRLVSLLNTAFGGRPGETTGSVDRHDDDGHDETDLTCALDHGDVDHFYDREEVEQLDAENGDIRCWQGYSYQTRTHHNPLADTKGEHVPPPNNPDDNNPDDEPYGTLDFHETDMVDVEHEAFDYSGFHDYSDDEFDDGLRWVAARDPKGDIYYWQKQLETETDEPHGAQYTSPKYKTEIWQFWHRNGETAIGTDPLEFWHDWVGAEAGDVAEPLPIGYAMRTFIHKTFIRKTKTSGEEQNGGPSSYQCSTEYIAAKGGKQFTHGWFRRPVSYYDDEELNMIEQYTNRCDWEGSEGERYY